jgi:hypothetical protein
VREHGRNNGKTFTDELWPSIETIYASILRHPFLRGLPHHPEPSSAAPPNR